jgi:hypothetical protein
LGNSLFRSQIEAGTKYQASGIRHVEEMANNDSQLEPPEQDGMLQ